MWESYGEIRERWASADYERGKYGYPRGPVELKDGKAARQQYDSDTIEVK